MGDNFCWSLVKDGEPFIYIMKNSKKGLFRFCMHKVFNLYENNNKVFQSEPVLFFSAQVSSRYTNPFKSAERAVRCTNLTHIELLLWREN